MGGVQRRGGAGPVRAQPGAHRPGHGGGLDGAGQAGSARRGVRARACGHVHGPAVPGLRQRLAPALSLWRDGAPVFAEDGEALRYWVGGTLVTVAGATSICVPTINSFRRQVDFAAVPTTPTWGEDNKGRPCGRSPDPLRRCASSIGWRPPTPTPISCSPRSSPAGWPAWRSASTRRSR